MSDTEHSIGLDGRCAVCDPPSPGWATINDRTEPDTLEEAVGQALGYASVCWSPSPEGVFESEKASAMADQLVVWIKRHGSSDLDYATDPGDPFAYPSTPGEFAARWNSKTEEQRAAFLKAMIAASERSALCLTTHDGTRRVPSYGDKL